MRATLAIVGSGSERADALAKCKAAFTAMGKADHWLGGETVREYQAELVIAHHALFPSETPPFPKFYPKVDEIDASLKSSVESRWPKVN